MRIASEYSRVNWKFSSSTCPCLRRICTVKFTWNFTFSSCNLNGKGLQRSFCYTFFVSNFTYYLRNKILTEGMSPEWYEELPQRWSVLEEPSKCLFLSRNSTWTVGTTVWTKLQSRTLTKIKKKNCIVCIVMRILKCTRNTLNGNLTLLVFDSVTILYICYFSNLLHNSYSSYGLRLKLTYDDEFGRLTEVFMHVVVHTAFWSQGFIQSTQAPWRKT